MLEFKIEIDYSSVIPSRDNDKTQDEVNRWLMVKSKEAQYVVNGVSLSLNISPASINLRQL